MSTAQQPAEMWLDRIPEGWQIIPAKAAFTERRQKSRPTDVHLTPSQKYGVLPQSEYMQITGSKVVLNLEGQDNMKHVEANDFIIHLRSFQGGIEWSDISGKVSMAYTVLTPRGCMISPTYYRWALKADAYIQELRSTTDQLRDGQSIKYATFAKIPLPLPPLGEQRAIADYLDQETAQIDALVAKQEEFIGLLRERRGAVQDRLLLSSDAPFIPLRHIAEQITVGIVVQPAQWYVDEGILALRGTNIKPERIDLADLVYLSNEGHARHFKSHLRAGDVVVVRTGQSGTAAVVPPELSGSNAIDLLLVRPNRRLLGEYLAMVLNAPGMREIANQEIVGTIQGHLNVAALRGLAIPVPEISDQRALVSEWRSASIAIDALIAKTEEHIALAKERRSALITAAVTGQINVRTAKKGARV